MAHAWRRTATILAAVILPSLAFAQAGDGFGSSMIAQQESLMSQPGRHFLQLPGPSNSPLAVLAAVAMPTIDHRGPEFQKLGKEVLARIRPVSARRIR